MKGPRSDSERISPTALCGLARFFLEHAAAHRAHGSQVAAGNVQRHADSETTARHVLTPQAMAACGSCAPTVHLRPTLGDPATPVAAPGVRALPRAQAEAHTACQVPSCRVTAHRRIYALPSERLVQAVAHMEVWRAACVPRVLARERAPQNMIGACLCSGSHCCRILNTLRPCVHRTRSPVAGAHLAYRRDGHAMAAAALVARCRPAASRPRPR